MKIGVIGGGAIGLLSSYYLNKHHDVTLYVRRLEQKQALNRYGITQSDLNKVNVEALLINELKEEQLIIVCLKQTQLSQVIEKLKHVNKETPIIFLQNGMSHVDLVGDLKGPVFFGIVEHGAVRVSDYHIKHLGKGVIKLAAYTASQKELQRYGNLLHQDQFPFVLFNEWEQLLKEKLIINAVINPLTALFNVENRYILHNSYIYHLAKQLCKEAAKVLNLPYDEQWVNVQKVAENTGENTSSMRADLLNNRQTEIDAISGYLLKESSFSIPYTSFVYQSIKAIEEQKGLGTADA